MGKLQALAQINSMRLSFFGLIISLALIISKQILTALAGATVSLGATFSLLAQGAQAASFVTTFTDGTDSSKWVKLEWSGVDSQSEGEEGFGWITEEELVGGISIWDNEGNRWESEVEDLIQSSFLFDLSTGQLQLEEGDFILYIDEDLEVGIQNYNGDMFKDGEWQWVDQVSWNLGFGLITLDSYDVATEKMESAVATAVATPEPSLTLGFIALGGLMLGGTIKNRKGKSQEVESEGVRLKLTSPNL
uniref:hypothetical protein n=1 Tax=Okeania sp. SIO2F4 TaxID=2607790 RepID=UPI0025D6E485|nr:hypothetical protein [Okeania sp. SIO2F4]